MRRIGTLIDDFTRKYPESVMIGMFVLSLAMVYGIAAVVGMMIR